ncbi:hypothetical protein NC652_034371 [Populus alba x Populus x berolinensis]|nr:hypothetical protein NC652_034371 [Populus alba x Populus x berolinensis]
MESRILISLKGGGDGFLLLLANKECLGVGTELEQGISDERSKRRPKVTETMRLAGSSQRNAKEWLYGDNNFCHLIS